MKNYGQASRLISIGKLQRLAALTHPTYQPGHLPGAFRDLAIQGDLILWRVSRLDAFSVSPFRT